MTRTIATALLVVFTLAGAAAAQSLPGPETPAYVKLGQRLEQQARAGKITWVRAAHRWNRAMQEALLPGATPRQREAIRRIAAASVALATEVDAGTTTPEYAKYELQKRIDRVTIQPHGTRLIEVLVVPAERPVERIAPAPVGTRVAEARLGVAERIRVSPPMIMLGVGY